MKEILSVLRGKTVVVTADEVVSEPNCLQRLLQEGLEIILIADRNEPVPGQALLKPGNIIRLNNISEEAYKGAWESVCKRFDCQWPTRREAAVVVGYTLHVDALDDPYLDNPATIPEVQQVLVAQRKIVRFSQILES